MKIGIIIEDGRMAGPQGYICNLTRSLTGMVDSVVFIPKLDSEEFVDKCRSTGIPYVLVPMTRLTRSYLEFVRYVCFSIFEILILARTIVHERADIIYIAGGSWQYKGLLAGKLAGKRVLWRLNDTLMHESIRKLFSLISPLADGFIYASARTKDYYKPIIRSSCIDWVISPPVDLDKFKPGLFYSQETEFLARWRDKFVIGTIVNIAPGKGIDVFIKMINEFNKCGKEALFVVIGPVYPSQKRYFETLKDLCLNLAVENIEFLGYRSDVRALLNRLDVYVCASDAESSPNSIREAMAMGKPIVTTNVGDVSEYIVEDENGFIVGVGDFDRISERLQLLLDDSKLRMSFGVRSREMAQHHFDSDHCARKHLEAFQLILGEV